MTDLHADLVECLPYAESLAKWCEAQADDPDNKDGAVTLLAIAETLRDADRRIRTHRDELLGVVEGWRPIESAPRDIGRAIVGWYDENEEWLESFECRDDGCWILHENQREHFVAVGGSAACGPDVVCVGPSEAPPYTHWMPLPAEPAIDAAIAGSIPADGQGVGA